MCFCKITQGIICINPDNEWSNFPSHLKPIVEREWSEFKYFEADSETINPLFQDTPNTYGGIYLFCINPNIIPIIQLYLTYIGKAKRETAYRSGRMTLPISVVQFGRMPTDWDFQRD